MAPGDTTVGSTPSRGVGCAVGRPQQVIQPGSGEERQARQNIGVNALVMGVQGGAHNPIHAFRRGRLDRQLAATFRNERSQTVPVAADGYRLVT